MDVINKLYTSVSSTVSQLSGVLPGNPVTREYDVLDHIASAGVGLLWKVYKGQKKSTRQEVAIFVFEKKQLEKWPKEDRDMMFDILKRGVQQLTKIRHPHVLTVQHPLEESRESLAFATEPVFSSLANLLSQTSNATHATISQYLKDFKLHDIEIKHGILQLAEGLNFLHSDMKLIHRNLCPESIIINKNGSWKLFGFDFCVAHQLSTDGKCFWPHQEYNSSWHALTQPYLEYTAPEVALHSLNTLESDLFSLGVLIYSIYSGGKPIKLFGKDYNAFRRFAGELNRGNYPNLACIPTGFSNLVKTLLNTNSDHRTKLHEIPKIPFFDDIGVKTLSYLDSLYQWDNLQKSKFYKGLPQIIPSFPHRISMQHILPNLVKEFVNSTMVPFVLPNVMLISESCSKQEFVDQILPHLKPIMKLQEPIQILLIFMQNMNLLLKLTPSEDVKADVLPMVYRALESNMPQMQELCLAILPTFSSLVDYQATKTALIPRIKNLCLHSQNISVKVNCLICIGKLLDSLDKWLVMDEIIPFLIKIDSREPAILMGIVGIFKIAMNNSKLGITKEIMASKIIPFLMPLCIENGLSVNQFNAVISLVKEMVNAIEKEHKVKLEQLSSIQKEASALTESNSFSNDSSINASVRAAEDMFANIKIMPPPSFEKTMKSSEPIDQDMPIKPMLPTTGAKQTTTNTDNLNQITSYHPTGMTFGTNIQTMQKNNTSILSNDFGFHTNTNTNTLTSPTADMGLWQTKAVPMMNNIGTGFINGNGNISSNTSMSSTPTSNLNSLDPFMDYRNKNKIPMNQMKKNERSALCAPLLMPTNENNQNEKQKLCTLSQQDILDFLN